MNAADGHEPMAAPASDAVEDDGQGPPLCDDPREGLCEGPLLEPETWLRLPHHRRMFTQYATTADGAPELRLFYDDKEISFVEPELFGFGEGLSRQARFQAGDAVAWADGVDWPRIQGLLGQLLDAGVLEIAEDDTPDDRLLGDGHARPSPLPPATCRHARSWTEGPELMQELTGHSLELGHLEVVLPIFRVAHIAMDSEGRQVGEANVFPPALRLDIETRWRTCIYPGSRYLDAKPMNVSALKSMRAHWGAIMALVLAVRQAYLQRFPQARQGWTVGHLERLSAAVLALPTYLLMRAQDAVPNGQLHPALASLFRVTDGVRLTMHQMLFIPIGEPTLPPDAPMDAAGIWAYAERTFGLHSSHGVCAGPQAMIEEFLAVLIEGRSPRDGLPEQLDEPLLEALRQLEPAMDYGLLGLQAFGTAFSMWPIMARAYLRLLQATEGAQGPQAQAWQQRLAALVERLQTASYLGTEELRAGRERVYADMVARCAEGLGDPVDPVGLLERLSARQEPSHGPVHAALLAAWQGRIDDVDAGIAERLARETMVFLQQAQAVLRASIPIQQRINRLLGRAEPQQPLTLDHLGLYTQLERQSDTAGRLPFLPDELGQGLQLKFHVRADELLLLAAAPAPAV